MDDFVKVLVPKRLYDAVFADLEEEEEEGRNGKSKMEIASLISNLPDRYKRVGERLVKFIESKGHGWTTDFELKDASGKVYSGKNIVDLVRDSVRPLSTTPKGLRDFYRLLRESKAPLSLITSTERRGLLTDTPEDDVADGIGRDWLTI